MGFYAAPAAAAAAVVAAAAAAAAVGAAALALALLVLPRRACSLAGRGARREGPKNYALSCA